MYKIHKKFVLHIILKTKTKKKFFLKKINFKAFKIKELQ